MSDDMRQPPNGGSHPITLACPENIPPELLSAWRDNVLPSVQAARLEAHTPTCAACSERLRDYDAASSALNTQLIPRSGNDLWPGVRAAIERETYRAARPGLRLPRGLALGGVGAGIAALLLVALFAGLLFTHKLGNPTTAATPSTTTGPAPTEATALPTTIPKGPGLWTTLTGCPANTPIPYHVLYEASVEQQKGAPSLLTFQRSDNCGETWTQLTPPAISGVDYTNNLEVETIFITPNPINPKIAYLSVLLDSAVGCSDFPPAGAAIALSSTPCLLQFVTTDSGANWNRMSMPVKGSLAVTSQRNAGSAIQGPFRAQGSLLYGVATDTVPGSSGVIPPGRLVDSSDGVHWNSVDAALAAKGLGVYDFAVTPTDLFGATIYVTAQPFNDPNDQPPTYTPTLSLWASSDGGRTWTETSHGSGTPYALGNGIGGMVAGQNGSQPILYIISGNKTQEQLLASKDGGRNWTIDTHYPVGTGVAMLGTLQDGSVVLEARDASLPTLAWAPGSQQQQVADSVGSQYFNNPVIQQADGGEYLWLTSEVDNNGDTATMYVKLKF